MCATEHFFPIDNQQYAKNIALIAINFFYIIFLYFDHMRASNRFEDYYSEPLLNYLHCSI